MYKAIYKCWALGLFVLLSLHIHAQSNIVTGTLMEGNSTDAVIGASIIVQGTNLGTITDIDGSFSVETNKPTDTLLISYVGFQDLIVPLAGRTSLKLDMFLDNNQLDEVVVVGYGRQKRKVVTGAVARVDAEDITATPINRIEQALQGRTPGVQVTSISGQPGDEPTVRVRGIGTTGNSKPLYIVDGIAVGGIDYLNPGDIESVDVLKDAASAAIYGARAANGVILITTKTGKKGKMNVGFDSYFGVQNVGNTLNMLNADQYRNLMNEGARNAGLTEPFDPLEISQHDTNWQNALFVDNAPMQNHQLSVNGGNEKSTYASSVSYFSQEGIIGGERSKFDRITGRLNAVHQVNKVFAFGTNIGLTHLTKRGIGTNQSFNGAYSSALNLDPLTPVFEDDATELNSYPYSIEPVVTNSEGRAYGISDYVGAEVVNPLALLETQNATTRKDQIVGSIYGTLEPIKNLKFRSTMSIDAAYVLDDSFRPLFFLNGAQLNDNKTTVNKEIKRYFTWQWENTVSYEKKINDHTFNGLAGISALEFNFENLSGFNADVPTFDPENVYLNLATDTTDQAGGGADHSSLYSLFGRVNYNYKDKYSVTAILRKDGSSRFGSNNRFGIFPSVGFAWVASDEDFFQNIGVLNYLKFRASYGINGNQEIGDYQFLSRIDKTRLYQIGSGVALGASPFSISNADIKWEESEQLNFGVDFGLFENKLQATVEYYIKNTNGLLETIAIPGHVGNGASVSNAGSVQNKGIEWSLDWREVAGDFKYYVGINGAFNQNEMTFIGNSEKVITGASWALAGAVTRTEEGLPISYFWGYETDGLFQNQTEVFSHINQDGELLQPVAVPGDVRFVDSNGDGVINEDDRTQIGNPTPDITFGINGSIEYKNIDLSLFFTGTYGNDNFNGTQRRDLRFTNRTTDILNRWTGEGTSNSVPRYTWIDTNNNARVSDLYIEDGSYIRLKNVQLGYNLPGKFLQKLGAERWRFYISGENLLTLTNYTGVDPEIGSQSSFDIGIDRAVYPQPVTFRFGTSVTF